MTYPQWADFSRGVVIVVAGIVLFVVVVGIIAVWVRTLRRWRNGGSKNDE